MSDFSSPGPGDATRDNYIKRESATTRRLAAQQAAVRTASRRMEQEAFDLTLKWIKASPFYEDKKLSPREYALVKLALRMMTHPQEYPREVAR